MRRLIKALSFAFLLSVTTPAGAQTSQPASPPINTFSVQGFQSDLFTGAATSEISIMVAPGMSGVAPKIALRYNSSAAEAEVSAGVSVSAAYTCRTEPITCPVCSQWS